LYGAKLAALGCDVEFQTGSGYRELNQKGLKLKSVWGDLSLGVKAFPSTREMTPGDIVLVCVKAAEQIDYKSLIEPVVGPGSLICLIQNGINNDERIHALFPDNPFCGAAAFVCSNRISPCEVHHLAYGRIELCWFGEQPHPSIRNLESLFLDADVDCHCVGEIRMVRWKKLLWNIPFNTLSVITGGEDTRTMIGSADLLPLIKTLMSEVRAAACAEGYSLSESESEKMILNTQNMVPYKTSMLLDFEARRPMEIKAILEEPVASAQAVGCPMPSVKVLASLMRELERKNLG
jgi:2-dehydropantoate 2-reductase